MLPQNRCKMQNHWDPNKLCASFWASTQLIYSTHYLSHHMLWSPREMVCSWMLKFSAFSIPWFPYQHFYMQNALVNYFKLIIYLINYVSILINLFINTNARVWVCWVTVMIKLITKSLYSLYSTCFQVVQQGSIFTWTRTLTQHHLLPPSEASHMAVAAPIWA